MYLILLASSLGVLWSTSRTKLIRKSVKIKLVTFIILITSDFLYFTDVNFFWTL
jgi:hypothetical protein